jgi:hypothetical protein
MSAVNPKEAGSAARPEGKAKDHRDERLWSLLPSKDAPYAYCSLSKAETDALIEALSDGFGDALVSGRNALPLPAKVKSGLVDHLFYRRVNTEYDPTHYDDAFWSSANGDDAPAPYEQFPLGFNPRRLRVYFENQFERFCEQLAREEPECASLDASLYEEFHALLGYPANERLYEKPWYEFHALQFLDFIELSVERLSKYPALMILSISGSAGQLGRLIEQYYWRFRFEGAAITGIGAQRGASAGGRAKARFHQAEQSRWQDAASEIWTRRPALSKIAVAKIIQKDLREAHSPKHIARYIVRPQIEK